MQARHVAALLCLPLLSLSACVTPTPAAIGSRTPVYSTDLVHKAASCTVPSVSLEDGKEAIAAMTTGGGGWCGISVRHNDQPFGAGLLTQQPRNGAVYVHTVGDDTRVDYTPRSGAAGADAFTVRFIPGDATMRVTVNGVAPAGAAK